MDEAFINGDVLRWARTRRNLSHAELAKKLRVKPKQIESWENEISYPPLGKAEQLAEKLRIPFGYFWFTEVPSDEAPLPDLRTIADKVTAKLSADALEQLHSIIRKQEWYREYLEENAPKPKPFVGSFAVGDSTQEVASSIRNALRISPELRKQGSWSTYLSNLINNAEEIGVLVIRSGIVKSSTKRTLSVGEFRGFAIADTLAPLVFINGNDFVAAKIFTLIHELAHVWLNQEGLSNASGIDEDSALVLERYCNKVAAEVLVPTEEFGRCWSFHKHPAHRIQRLASLFKVSALVIIRRACELGFISRSEYFAMVAEAKAKQQTKMKRKGGDPNRNVIARNSWPLVDAVVESVRRNKLIYRDASLVLGVPVGQVGKLVERGSIQ